LPGKGSGQFPGVFGNTLFLHANLIKNNAPLLIFSFEGQRITREIRSTKERVEVGGIPI
jgi:hypothetical protein